MNKLDMVKDILNCVPYYGEMAENQIAYNSMGSPGIELPYEKYQEIMNQFKNNNVFICGSPLLSGIDVRYNVDTDDFEFEAYVVKTKKINEWDTAKNLFIYQIFKDPKDNIFIRAAEMLDDSIYIKR